MQAIMPSVAAHAPEVVTLVAPSGGAAGAVVVPDAHLLFTADFSRHGQDLVLTGEHGERFVVVDYFLADHHPDLVSTTGAVLSAGIVDRMAGSVAPGQYSQAGGAPAAAANAIGRVEAASGDATCIRNGVSIVLNVGDVVLKGDVVQTGRGSSLALSFLDGTAFNLTSNARMALDDLVYSDGGSDNQAVFSLVQGSISFLAGKIAKTGDMRVDTPVTTMGIRGTAVLVDILSNDGAARFSVMVEQNGAVGSYVLLNKTTGAVLATVNQPDTVVYVTPVGSGQVSLQTATKSPQDLQQESALVAFLTPIAVPPNLQPGDQQPGGPNLNPRAGRGSSGSGGAFGDDGNVGDSGDGNDHNGGGGGLVEHRIGDASIISVEYLVTQPKLITPLEVVPFNGIQTVDSLLTTVTIKLQVIAPTTDTVVPFVADTAKILSVTGPAIIPPGVVLTDLVKLDPSKGTVTFDNSAFAFLAEGEKVVYSVAFSAVVNGTTMTEVLPITITGINDAPTVTAPAQTVTLDAAVALPPALAAAVLAPPPGPTAPDQKVQATGSFAFKDADLSDTHKVVVAADPADFGTIKATIADSTGTGEGKVSWTYEVAQTALRALGGGEIQHDTFTFTVTDSHGKAVTETVSVDLVGQNDAPTITVANVTDQVVPDHAPLATSFRLADRTSIVDPDLHDVKVPYVAGSACLVGISGPACPPVDLSSLVSIDQATGEVRYDPEAFYFLRPGQSVDYTIAYKAASGVDVREETLDLTIKGPDYTPAKAPSLAVSAPAPQTSFSDAAAIGKTLNLHAGDVVTIQYAYVESQPANDGSFAFVGLGSAVKLLDLPQVSSSDGATAWKTVTLVATADGPVQFFAGQLNSHDTHLFLDNLQVNGVLVDGFESAHLDGWAVDGPAGIAGASSDADLGPGGTPIAPASGSGMVLIDSDGGDLSGLSQVIGAPAATVLAVSPPGTMAGTPIDIAVGISAQKGNYPDDMYLTIKGAPAGSTIAHGVFDAASDSWRVDAADLNGHITLTTPAAFSGVVTLDITATAVVNADHSQATSAPQEVTLGFSPSDTGAQVLSLAGSPTVTGGSGDDMFHFTQATVAAVVTDFHPASASGSEHDLILVDHQLFATAQAVLGAAVDTPAGDVSIMAGGHSLLLKGVHVAGLTAGDFVIA